MKKKFVSLAAFLLGFSLFSLESQNSEIPFVKQISITDPNYTFYVEKDQGYYKFMRKNTLGVMEQTCLYGSHFYPFTVKEESCDDGYVFHSLDHNEPLFLAETNFFSNYFSSNLKEQLEEKRLPKTTAFIADINKDNDDEFIEFTYPYSKYLLNDKEIFVSESRNEAPRRRASGYRLASCYKPKSSSS